MEYLKIIIQGRLSTRAFGPSGVLAAQMCTSGRLQDGEALDAVARRPFAVIVVFVRWLGRDK